MLRLQLWSKIAYPSSCVRNSRPREQTTKMPEAIECQTCSRHHTCDGPLGRGYCSEDPTYIAFCPRLSAMRRKLCQTAVAHIVPQAQRKKSPCQNIRQITEWASGMLAFLAGPQATLPENARAARELHWLQSSRMLISELGDLVVASDGCEKINKHSGLTQETASQCNPIALGNAKILYLQ